MIYKYKVGDKVRINERKGKSSEYPDYFTGEQAALEGKIFIIEEIFPDSLTYEEKACKYYNGDDSLYRLKDDDLGWAWHSSMFEPVLEDHKSEICISLKEGDLLLICGMVGKILHDTEIKGYFLNFDGIREQPGHFVCCRKLRELVPNFDKIADKFGTFCNIDKQLFPEFSTIDKLMRFVQAINTEYNSKQPTILKKLETYEIRFQKPKASSIRGSVPTGRAICGRRCKTAIELGHLSNTTCYC